MAFRALIAAGGLIVLAEEGGLLALHNRETAGCARISALSRIVPTRTSKAICLLMFRDVSRGRSLHSATGANELERL